MIFIANPNNPTGTYNTRDEVEKFLGMIPSRVLPVFDEAYFEYAATKEDYPSMIEDYYKRRPMAVLRTFSKIHGLAGLRVGYGVMPEAVVHELDKIKPPFNVSSPAQAAAIAAFRDLSHVKKSVAHNEKERDYLTAELTKMGFKVVPSCANFILFTGFPMKGRVLFEELLLKALITRAVDEYNLPEYLRVTVGERSENKKFLEALREVVKTS
jgi:histidinol-phosphate aminotransferase